MIPSHLEHSWLARHFDFRLPIVANFVGGGGKTGLILSLIQEYAETCPALFTTTTRIHPPPLAGGLSIISSDNEQLLKLLVRQLGERFHGQKCSLVVTRAAIRPGLLRGVAADFAASIEGEHFPLFLNEADGARSMSIKIPRAGEPVLMQGADYLIPVIGLDCLDEPLGPDAVFRWELADKKLSKRAGDLLTPELAAEILLHPDGVCRDWKPGCKIIVFVNKVDTPAQDPKAFALTRALLQNRHYPIERVVWGSLRSKRADSLSSRFL